MSDAIWSVLEWRFKGSEFSLRRHGPYLHDVAMGKRDQLNRSGASILSVTRDVRPSREQHGEA